MVSARQGNFESTIGLHVSVGSHVLDAPKVELRVAATQPIQLFEPRATVEYRIGSGDPRSVSATVFLRGLSRGGGQQDFQSPRRVPTWRPKIILVCAPSPAGGMIT